MPTATAYKIRPKGSKTQQVTVDLVLATEDDFKDVSGYRQTPHGTVPIVKLRRGMVYWLYSKEKQTMEPHPYQVTEATDPMALKGYLENKMVYIAKNPFRN